MPPKLPELNMRKDKLTYNNSFHLTRYEFKINFRLIKSGIEHQIAILTCISRKRNLGSYYEIEYLLNCHY